MGFLTFCLSAGTLAGWIKRSPLMTSVVMGTFSPKSPASAFGKEHMTVLLLGCDEDRAYSGYRTSRVLRKYARADMILVARLDFEKKTITGVSIPRDTECQLPGYRRRKVNEYHSIAKQGEENALMAAAVEHLLPGVKIDRVLVIDYDAFQRLVDIVGGVDVNVARPMHYDDFAGNLHVHLEPGPKRLSGREAMGYVRFRKDIESDFGRQQRQKEFLASFRSAVWRDPLRLPEVAEIGKSVLNGALTNEEVASLAFFARSLPTKSIQLGMVPVKEGSGTRLRIDESKLEAVLQEFKLVGGAAQESLSARGD